MPATKKMQGRGSGDLYFDVVKDPKTGEEIYEVYVTGKALLGLPALNKGTAFTEEERRELELEGLLPPHVLTIDQQLDRIRREYLREYDDIGRNMFLTALHDRNEALFLKFVQGHITEMMPIVYTPVVGETVKQYSRFYQRGRGLYISYPQRDRMEQMFDNWPRPQLDAICVTDSEAILGIGDQGLGGMGIPVAKLVVYTLCAGVKPMNLMPVALDVGTNNQELLEDPLYLGWRHERLRGAEYDEFIDMFVQAVKRRWPNVLLHWEDFGKVTARRLLDKYRHEICSFNDDIQGTAAVTLAALISAVQHAQSKFADQRVIVFGAGTAGVGIADEIVSAMLREGVSEADALSKMYLLNSKGLIHEESQSLEPMQLRYVRKRKELERWNLKDPNRVSLRDVVFNVKPTMLIGTSTQPGSFTEEIVREMAAHTARPIVFPLSNPTSKAEATPSDLMNWTEGRALVATGTPFPDVLYGGRRIRIGNCNNAFIFPGLALGTIACGAREISDEMISAAGIELAKWSCCGGDPHSPLMPTLDDVMMISHDVAVAVGVAAQRQGLAEKSSLEELETKVTERKWKGDYYRYRKGKV